VPNGPDDGLVSTLADIPGSVQILVIAPAAGVKPVAPGVACLMFTAFSDDQALLDSILAGAAGYTLKQVRGSDLAVAVRTVYQYLVATRTSATGRGSTEDARRCFAGPRSSSRAADSFTRGRSRLRWRLASL
jgi:DNA-binding NarL/FixJ family response regulator